MPEDANSKNNIVYCILNIEYCKSPQVDFSLYISYLYIR